VGAKLEVKVAMAKEWGSFYVVVGKVFRFCDVLENMTKLSWFSLKNAILI